MRKRRITPIDVTMSVKAKEIHRRRVVPFASGKSAIIYFLKEYVNREVLVIPLEEEK